LKKHFLTIKTWEGNDVYVAFPADDVTTPPARLAVDDIELIEAQVDVGDSVKIVDSTSKVFGHRGVVLSKEELETGSPRSLRIVDQSLILDAQGVHVKVRDTRRQVWLSIFADTRPLPRHFCFRPVQFCRRPTPGGTTAAASGKYHVHYVLHTSRLRVGVLTWFRRSGTDATLA
jgi:hypothetical protein